MPTGNACANCVWYSTYRGYPHQQHLCGVPLGTDTHQGQKKDCYAMRKVGQACERGKLFKDKNHVDES